jgi:NADP-dependent aldehyde dehydrogenase
MVSQNQVMPTIPKHVPLYPDATIQEIDSCLHKAWDAFSWLRESPPALRRDLLYAIADELTGLGDNLIETAEKETSLPIARLRAERSRTIRQLTAYADFATQGKHLDICIDTKTATSPDIRKMNIPLGPVVVFGASNFPFAYSTAGGDTASALAAGCSVIVKAHPAHPATSLMTAGAIIKAVKKMGMPENIFQHVFGAAAAVGEALVKHPLTKAVGFTGSYTGGKQLFDWGNQRLEPIPVFAEMGSVNPVYLLPGKLSAETEQVASMYADSISLGAGQFCTNPGILIALENDCTKKFADILTRKLDDVQLSEMLHAGIRERYDVLRNEALSQKGVSQLTTRELTEDIKRKLTNPGIPTLAMVQAADFLANPVLHHEVFGPYSLLVACKHMDQMKEVAAGMPGQLTSSIMATEAECLMHQDLLNEIRLHAGRIILNAVPTGVEVTQAMHHGGPFPASTDSRFTSVGPDAIRRFVRPVCYQNWPDNLLPDALKNSNPLKCPRMINGNMSMKPITG